jgi:hypothetical protein
MRDSRLFQRRTRLRAPRILCVLSVAAALLASNAFAGRPSRLLAVQDSFPAPPTDRDVIYIVNETGTLEALPFEAGTTPLKTDARAGSDKTSYVELKGLEAAKAVVGAEPRFYLFVEDAPNVHPPLIVRLAEKRGARRVTAMAQKGLAGFAIYADEIVKPHYRVLGRDRGMLYMEIRPRVPLFPGEYAIMGTYLKRIATFRVKGTSNP